MLNKGNTIRAALCALMLTALAFTPGCAGEKRAEPRPGDSGKIETRSFTAHNGDITIPVNPRRIVALNNAAPALLVAGAPLIGTTEIRPDQLDLIPSEAAHDQYKTLTVVSWGMAGASAGGGLTLDYEAIAALEPDLIVSAFPQQYEKTLDEARLQMIAPTVFIGPTTPRDWQEVGKMAADAAGVTGKFSVLQGEYERLAQDIAHRHADKITGVAFGAATVWDVSEEGTYYRDYSGSYSTNIPESTGMKFPGGESFGESISLERISELANADVLLVSINPDGAVRDHRFQEEVIDTDAWRALPAVQAGRILRVPYLLAWNYAGAIESLKALDQQLDALKLN